ncbi:ketoacyl-ACP synthase III family protein [Actinoallomurus acanthiterrae]
MSIETAVERGLYPAEEVEVFQVAGAAVAGDVPAPEMALRAARDAFSRCAERPTDLDLLLYSDVWHQGPEGWQPQYYLQQHLVGGDVLAVEVKHGCSGMFSSLELAASYLRADSARRTALLVSADNFGTRLVNRWRMIPGVVMGDAACAALLGTEPGFAELLSVNLVTVPEAEAVNQGSDPLFPPDATIGRELDFGARNERFRQELLANQGTGPLFTVQKAMLEVVEQTLTEAGVALGDVKRVAFPHVRRDDIEWRGVNWLGLSMSQSTWEFGRTVGHLGAADQFVALDHLLETGRLARGDHLLMVGFGAGTTIAAAVVRILEEPPRRPDRARHG